MNLAVAIAELVGAGLLITKAISGKTWQQVISGQAFTPTAAGSYASAPAGAGVFTAGTVTTTETGFARRFLTSIGAPLNKVNIKALEDWWAQEEGNFVLAPGHGGLNNPFEVTTSGNANIPTLGSVNSAGVKSYATPQQGVQAAIGYFQTYGPGVLQALRQGKSITSIENAVRALGPNAFGSDTNPTWN